MMRNNITLMALAVLLVFATANFAATNNGPTVSPPANNSNMAAAGPVEVNLNNVNSGAQAANGTWQWATNTAGMTAGATALKNAILMTTATAGTTTGTTTNNGAPRKFLKNNLSAANTAAQTATRQNIGISMNV